MGDPITSALVAVGVSWWQGEEAEKEQKRAERRQAEADRKAELIAEAQRQQDLAEKQKQEELLPPIIGSQRGEEEFGIEALTFDEDSPESDIGVQIGTSGITSVRGTGEAGSR